MCLNTRKYGSQKKWVVCLEWIWLNFRISLHKNNQLSIFAILSNFYIRANTHGLNDSIVLYKIHYTIREYYIQTTFIEYLHELPYNSEQTGSRNESVRYESLPVRMRKNKPKSGDWLRVFVILSTKFLRHKFNAIIFALSY